MSESLHDHHLIFVAGGHPVWPVPTWVPSQLTERAQQLLNDVRICKSPDQMHKHSLVVWFCNPEWPYSGGAPTS